MNVRGIVFRHAPDVVLPTEPVPVTVEFDASRPIGLARLSRGADGHVYADMELAEPLDGTPAAGLRDGEILTIGICRPTVTP